jgi:hypothetical protein
VLCIVFTMPSLLNQFHHCDIFVFEFMILQQK